MDGPGSGKRSLLCLNACASTMSAGSPVRSPWQFDRLELFDVTAEIQAVALCRGLRAGCPATPETVQQARQCLNRVSPLLRSTAPIIRAAVSDNRRWLRRRSCGGSLGTRPIGCESLGGVARDRRGWWSRHSSLVSRDASRVQWIGMHLGVLTAICRRAEMADLVVTKQLGVP